MRNKKFTQQLNLLQYEIKYDITSKIKLMKKI